MTERRERWALLFSSLSGWREEHVAAHGQMPEHYEAADAAMAVADAEMDSVHRSLAEERDVAVSMEAENIRLRAELKAEQYQASAAREERDDSEDIIDGLITRIGDLEATISRVIAVVDDNPGWSYAELVRRTYAALNGDSND